MTRFITVIITVIIFVLTSISCSSTKKHLKTEAKGTSIIVKPKLTIDKGMIYYSLYNSEESFMNKTPLQSKIVKVKNNAAEVVFTNIPKGTYAVLCFQDLNDNKNLDFEGYIPTEPYGMSNNPQLMGPPQFDMLKFEIGESDVTIELEM